MDWKLVNVVPSFQKGKKEDSHKNTEKIILRGFEKYMKQSAVIGHNQHGFARGKTCLMILISFYDL